MYSASAECESHENYSMTTLMDGKSKTNCTLWFVELRLWKTEGKKKVFRGASRPAAQNMAKKKYFHHLTLSGQPPKTR